MKQDPRKIKSQLSAGFLFVLLFQINLEYLLYELQDPKR